MIFVVLGIAILIISFVIALISLIREGKQSHEVQEGQPLPIQDSQLEVDQEHETAPRGQTSQEHLAELQKKLDQAGKADKKGPAEYVKPEGDNQNRGPFPWEYTDDLKTPEHVDQSPPLSGSFSLKDLKKPKP